MWTGKTSADRCLELPDEVLRQLMSHVDDTKGATPSFRPHGKGNEPSDCVSVIVRAEDMILERTCSNILQKILRCLIHERNQGSSHGCLVIRPIVRQPDFDRPPVRVVIVFGAVLVPDALLTSYPRACNLLRLHETQDAVDIIVLRQPQQHRGRDLHHTASTICLGALRTASPMSATPAMTHFVPSHTRVPNPEDPPAEVPGKGCRIQ